MSSDRRGRTGSFADLVAALPRDPEQPRAETVVSPLQGRSWTDADGVLWTRRGSDLSPRRVRQLLSDAAVRVVRVTSEAPEEVAPSGRAALGERIEPWLRGAPRRPGDHLDVRVGEFRAPGGARLLVVEERC